MFGPLIGRACLTFRGLSLGILRGKSFNHDDVVAVKFFIRVGSVYIRHGYACFKSALREQSDFEFNVHRLNETFLIRYTSIYFCDLGNVGVLRGAHVANGMLVTHA